MPPKIFIFWKFTAFFYQALEVVVLTVTLESINIIIKHDDDMNSELLNYSLSNKIDDIEIAIFNRTGQVVKLKNAHWIINPYLSVFVKQLMNKHNVKYAMTTRQEKIKNKEYRTITINMRSDDIWLIAWFEEFDGRFVCGDRVETYRAFVKFISPLLEDDE